MCPAPSQSRGPRGRDPRSRDPPANSFSSAGQSLLTATPSRAIVPFSLPRLRKDFEAFLKETQREEYRNGAGLKVELNTAAIFRRHAWLFGRDILERVRDFRREASGEEERRLRLLLAALADEYLRNEVKELTDRYGTETSKREVRVDGEVLPFRTSQVVMNNEDNRDRRKAIFEARNLVFADLNAILRERMETMHRIAMEIGYDHYLQMFNDVKALDVPGVHRMMAEFLSRTASLYRRKMEEHLSRLGLDLDVAERFDTAYLFRGKEFDPSFPRERAVPVLKATLKGLGFDLAKQRNITLDVKERPRKSPRAFCAAIEIPERIYLVTMPQGGHDDVATLFHEAGHAEHFANCGRRLPFEYKYLGDNSVTEGMAFLLEYVTLDRGWLERFAPGLDIGALLDFSYTYKLHFLRRYAAKLGYEMELHTKGVEGMDGAYARSLEAALLYRHPRELYLADVDDALYCANYLRAWVFEAQMAEALREKFGDPWWAEKGAGKFLKSQWAKGQKYDAVELVRDLGYGGLDVDPLVERIETNLAA